jgi:hypothetical protein
MEEELEVREEIRESSRIPCSYGLGVWPADGQNVTEQTTQSLLNEDNA